MSVPGAGPRHQCCREMGSRVGVQARAGCGEIGASRQMPACACFYRDTNVRFSAELRRLQSLPKCQRLPLPSFLLLPFQRITRLRMLLQVPVLAWALFGPTNPVGELSPGASCPTITISHPTTNTRIP